MNRTARLSVRIWDALALLLVAFPFFTGGVWVRRPHLKIELTELAVPVLIVGLFAAILSFFSSKESRGAAAPTPSWTSESWVLSQARKALNWWTERLEKQRLKTLLLGSLPVFFFYALAALRRHWAFHTAPFDLGIFGNAIANFTLGNGYVSSVKGGINLFADHQSPSFFLYVPFYFLFPRAETLLILQALLLASSGIAAGLLARQALPRKSSATSLICAGVPLLVWIFPPIRVANLFDFHPETMMLPAFLWAILGIQSKSRRAQIAGWIAFGVGILSKESGGPIAVGIGLVWVLHAVLKSPLPAARLKSGIIAMALGISWFLFATKEIPQLLNHPYIYDELFAQYGGGLKGILTSPILKPEIFWPQIFSGSRIQFYLFLLAPLAFLPLLAPAIAIGALPGILMIVLSAGNSRVAPIYHYGIEPSIGLIWALPLGWAWAESKLRENRIRTFRFFILFFALVSYNKSEVFEIRFHAGDEHTHWLRDEFLPRVSAKTVSASGNLVAHLIHRPWIEYLPHYLTAQNRPVDCVISDPKVLNWSLEAADRDRLESEMARLAFKPIYICDDLKVFQNDHAETPCFSVPPESIPCRRSN